MNKIQNLYTQTLIFILDLLKLEKEAQNPKLQIKLTFSLASFFNMKINCIYYSKFSG